MICVWRLSVCLTSDVCLSRISGLSRVQRGYRKTKIGTEVANATRDSDTTFKVKRSKVNLQGAGAYCGGLAHRLLEHCYEIGLCFCACIVPRGSTYLGWTALSWSARRASVLSAMDEAVAASRWWTTADAPWPSTTSAGPRDVRPAGWVLEAAAMTNSQRRSTAPSCRPSPPNCPQASSSPTFTLTQSRSVRLTDWLTVLWQFEPL